MKIEATKVDGFPGWWSVLHGGLFVGLHWGTEASAVAQGHAIVAQWGDVWKGTR